MARSLPTVKDLKFGRLAEKKVASNLTIINEPHRWYNQDDEEWGRDFYLTGRHLFLEVEGRHCVDEKGRDIKAMALRHGVHFRKPTVDHCWNLDIQTFYMVVWDDWKTFHLAAMETILREGEYKLVQTKRGEDEFYSMETNSIFTGRFRP